MSAGGSGADWQLESGLYQLGDYKVNASGRVTTRRDWPVDLNVQATLPPPSGDRWAVDLNLSGSARDLRISGQSRGYLDATLEGEVAPLDTTLPARLRITSKQFRAMDSVPDTLVLKDWFVAADGSLASGFQTRGEATLPGSEGPISLSLSGKVDTESATDVNLVLSTRTSEGEGQASVRGQVSWRDGLEARAELALSRFPGTRCCPISRNPLLR